MKNRKNLKRVALYSLLVSLYVMPTWAEQMKPFSLPNLSGEGTISSKNYKGKVMIVDFWASWCAPCKASFAAYNELLKKYASKELVIIGINIDNDKEKALEFLAENPASFHIAADPTKEVAEAYNLPTMPTAYIIGRSGDILYTHPGYHEGDLPEMEKEIEEALNK
ncbi:MAG: TlpA family protein disulfide reductase [Alphaproteobacteria bacterium]|nr:TlpA family protein disulfide reductase [Alphaproteobacteria bacterium]